MTQPLTERLRELAVEWFEMCGDIHEPLNEAADHIEALEATQAELVEALHGLRRIMLPMHMTMAQAECVDEPIPDDAVFLSFMDSGASDQVTAGEFRRANEAANTILAKLEQQP